MKINKSHLLFWTAYLIFGIVTDFLSESRIVIIDEILIFFTNNLFIFYTTLWAAKKARFNSLRNIIIAILRFLIFIILYCTIRFLYKEYIQISLNSPYAGIKGLQDFFISCSLWYVQFSLLAFGYYYLLKAKKSELEKVKLENLNKDLEAQKTIAEFNYLKAQINPHFLYNTLNMFYGQVAATMPQTGKGIMLLTEIMRYSLNTGSREDSRVYLDEELEQLDNYIELQQLRFNNKLMIHKTISGDISGILILPHVFITFAENAIKYGETHDPETPIDINVSVSEKEIIFSIKNNIGRSAKEPSKTGLGIENAFSRMKMQYGELLHYSYGKNNDNTIFHVQFNITLTPDMIKRKAESIIQTAVIV